LAGVGACAHPDELFERLSDEQWTGWMLWAKHFSTPLRRADINSALERQAIIAPHCQRGRLPTVNDLLPKYGRDGAPKRKPPRELFKLADATLTAVAIEQAANPHAAATPVKVQRKRR
jgi:hypothetical protein